MAILLDTHAFVWWAFDDRRLSRAARSAIQDDARVHVSAVVVWEIAGKVRTGKWPEAEALSHRLLETIAGYEMVPLPVTLEHANLAGTMPGVHRDPFDRMLAAQAITEDIPLVTADPVFREFESRVLW